MILLIGGDALRFCILPQGFAALTLKELAG